MPRMMGGMMGMGMMGGMMGGGMMSHQSALNHAMQYSSMSMMGMGMMGRGMLGGQMFSGGMLGGGMMGGGMMNAFSSNPQQSNNLPVSTGNSLTNQYGTGLKGYANWWNAEGKQAAIDREKAYAADNPKAGLSKMVHHNISLTSNGLFDWDSTKPINGLSVSKLSEID